MKDQVAMLVEEQHRTPHCLHVQKKTGKEDAKLKKCSYTIVSINSDKTHVMVHNSKEQIFFGTNSINQVYLCSFIHSFQLYFHKLKIQTQYLNKQRHLWRSSQKANKASKYCP